MNGFQEQLKLEFVPDVKVLIGIKKEKVKEYHKRYNIQWNQKNPGKSKEYRKKHYYKDIEKSREEGRKYYFDNKEKIKRNRLSQNFFVNKNKQWLKDFRQKVRKEVLEYYSKGIPRCTCCGETIIQFLGIDHINGGGKKHKKELKIMGNSIYRFLLKYNCPEGYQVLCHNCNLSLGFYGYCPHHPEIRRNLFNGKGKRNEKSN